jgi:hypothetical protein
MFPSLVNEEGKNGCHRLQQQQEDGSSCHFPMVDHNNID